jgi:hypothetical protein
MTVTAAWHPLRPLLRHARRWADRRLPELPTGRPFDGLPATCGMTRPGVEETPEWRDWTARPTTHDQLRIEAWLDAQPLTGTRLLHIGCGNSQLAVSFLSRVACIDAITIQRTEAALGKALSLASYRVLLANKYDPDLPDLLDRRYHFIIDNNPSAFCCCRGHFFVLLRNYRRLLERGGVVVTDRWGLDHSVTGNDRRWALSWEDWATLGGHVDLQAVQADDNIYLLRKRSSDAGRLLHYRRRLGALVSPGP